MPDPAPTQDVFNLQRFPVHLGLGASAIALPEHTGDMAWYESYAETASDDGVEGRLVSMHTFSSSWDTWEMHPLGTELVVATAGRCTLIQEIDGEQVKTAISVGDVAINRPGVWHTMDVEHPCTVLFVTAGMGTEVKER